MTDSDADARLRQRYEREHKARLEAEAIAERVTGELYSAVGELQRLNEELERTNLELEDKNQSLNEFVAVASHDIRGPLTSILGFAELLEKRWTRVEEEKKIEFLGVIQEQGRGLQRLVEDLLTVSRLDAGAMAAHPKPVLVCEQLTGVVERLGETATGIEVVGPGDLYALVDPDHLERILTNYVSNAIKYGAEPIRAEGTAADEWAEIRVRDSGGGVPEEFVHRLFGKFSRADDLETRSKPGTGLGLSIVQGLAVVNGGEAWYEPNSPHGSCFAVRLPRAAA